MTKSELRVAMLERKQGLIRNRKKYEDIGKYQERARRVKIYCCNKLTY